MSIVSKWQDQILINWIDDSMLASNPHLSNFENSKNISELQKIHISSNISRFSFMAELSHRRFPLPLTGCNSLPSSSSRTVFSFEIFIAASGSEISILVQLPLWINCTGLTPATGVWAVSQVEMADSAKPWQQRPLNSQSYLGCYVVFNSKHPPTDFF